MANATAILPAGSYATAADSILLSFAQRQAVPHHLNSEGGLHFHAHLDEAARLNDGDGLQLDDGRVIRVVARPERVAIVQCIAPRALAEAAWFVGSRHAAMMVSADGLMVRDDVVLVEGLKRLDGVDVTLGEAVFQPSAPRAAGQDAGGHRHEHHDHPHGDHHHDHADGDVDAAELAAAKARRAARLAERAAVPHVHGPGCGCDHHDHAHGHDHGHAHDHGNGHDHGHDRGHDH